MLSEYGKYTLRMPASLADQKCKQPWGTIYKGEGLKPAKQVKEIIKKKKYSKVIAVGDITVRNLLKVGLIPDLSIVDGKAERNITEAPDFDAINEECINPAGHITKDLWLSIERALKKDKPVRLFVVGEEDLAVVPAALLAEDACICYGQPKEGLVLVEVTEEKKRLAKHLVEKMEVLENGNSDN
ncbi:MAG: GTP-dependent dephospho-CoA kinase family protein [Candidatus Hydrothermarchaeota archaeon]